MLPGLDTEGGFTDIELYLYKLITSDGVNIIYCLPGRTLWDYI